MTLIMPDRTSIKSTFTFTQWYSKGGGDKIGGISKKLERERYFEGYKNFSKGAKNREGQKKALKNFGVSVKNLEGRQI